LAVALHFRLEKMDTADLAVGRGEVVGTTVEGEVVCRPESGGEEMYHLLQEAEDTVEAAEEDQEAGNG
jgi:hypothetical protein